MCRTSRTCYTRFLHLCDVACTCFVFFPLMVMYWRGIWDLWGVYVFPHSAYHRTIASLVIGSTTVLFYLAAPAVERSLASYQKPSPKCYHFLVRLFLYTYALFYMCYWRAVWETADLYLSAGTWQNGVTWLVCWVALTLLGVSRTAIFPPFLINLDTRDEVLTVGTRFNTQPYSIKFILDALFSFFIVITTTIVTWRCIWNFLTHLILPSDPIMSDLFCVGFGYLLALLIFAAEPLLARVTLNAERRGFWWKLAWEDFVYTCVFVASVVLWRGSWNCCATYMIPDMHLGGWINHIAGTIGLMLVQLFSYAGALGIGRDGLEPGCSAIFPIKYFRAYLLEDEDDLVEENSDIDEKVPMGEGPPIFRQETKTTMVPLTPEDRADSKLLMNEAPLHNSFDV